MWIWSQNKGVAVAFLAVGIIAASLVGGAAIKTWQASRIVCPVIVSYSDDGDIRERRPELFQGVSDMAMTKPVTKLQMWENKFAEAESVNSTTGIAEAEAMIKKLGGKVPSKLKPTSTKKESGING